MPSTLEEYFELMALCTEPADRGGAQIPLAEFNDMMPWHLDVLIDFKVRHRSSKAKPSGED